MRLWASAFARLFVGSWLPHGSPLQEVVEFPVGSFWRVADFEARFVGGYFVGFDFLPLPDFHFVAGFDLPSFARFPSGLSDSDFVVAAVVVSAIGVH